MEPDTERSGQNEVPKVVPGGHMVLKIEYSISYRIPAYICIYISNLAVPNFFLWMEEVSECHQRLQ